MWCSTRLRFRTILFLIYINDIDKAIPEEKLLLVSTLTSLHGDVLLSNSAFLVF